jgi:nitroreductase
MKVANALRQRKSVRAYLDTKVKTKVIKKILKSAGKAPSGVNTQPWKVIVLTSENKQALQQKMQEAFNNGKKPNMDYQYYPLEWKAPYKARRKECGLQMYNALDIKREDKKKQLNQWAANYHSFDAPVMILFFIDANMEKGSYLDYGMFIQSLMLAATEQGLGTCPQASIAEYPKIVRDYLNLPDTDLLIGGMAIGYEDKNAAVNSYRTSREKLKTWVTFA